MQKKQQYTLTQEYYYLLLLLFFISIFYNPNFAQVNPVFMQKNVLVDKKGVMVWAHDQKEVKGFGVNYTMPFAHAYRSAKKLGVNPLEAMTQDIYHFSRLGFDLYRVHVWDTEISDTLGNLLDNEHLDAFDFLVKKLNERQINYVLTPIAFWGNGWPEPDEATLGFSAKYGKDACLTTPEAMKAQEKYLYQFLNHLNPYTGVAYKDDPRLLAIEISNEPHHRESPENVTNFIKGMVEAIRSTGCKKPIFYNISHSVHLVENYFKAGIQGGTFQWYPTGLGYQKELSGNFLPNVEDYDIPFEAYIKKYQGAKIVYEFDAADIGKSYIYPAMARSFRTAGIQVATHFSYDPTFLAYANTEYNTHYMNLAYTPQKALALKICSEIFHQVPMYQDFGQYPKNKEFEGFFIDEAQNLALCNRDEKYFYTNTTTIAPNNISKLQHLAGYGNSPVVQYHGTGAYFLDKLENGVWRLEVMPDALVVDQPYGRNSLDKTVAVIQWNVHKMKIDLEELGQDFNLTPLNQGNDFQPVISKGQFFIAPGAYLLTAAGQQTAWKASDFWQNIQLQEFYAPPTTVNKTYVVHQPAPVAIANEPLIIEIQMISPDTATKVQLQITSGTNWKLIEMERKTGFNYTATIPKEEVKYGFLTYYLYIKNGDKVQTFPANQTGLPYDWDFYERSPYRVRVIKKDQAIYLFDAEEDWQECSLSWWSSESELVPTGAPHESEYQIKVNGLFQKDNENLNGPVIHDYTVKSYVNEKVDHIRNQLRNKQTLTIKARSLDATSKPIQVALVTKEGIAYGKIIELGTTLQEYEIPIKELKKVKTIPMPRPYPTFLPYYFELEKEEVFKIEEVEGIQISIGPGLPNQQLDQPHGVGLVSLSIK